MALTTVSNNALSNITAIPASIPTGALTLIKSITASSSASISFVDGTDGVVLDDTYKSYVFKFINMHTSASGSHFTFNISIDNGSNYNVAKTTTFFTAYHTENNVDAGLGYDAGFDLAQGTGFQPLIHYQGTDNDMGSSGSLQIFNPSSTVFVKHFISNFSGHLNNSTLYNTYCAGYGNTTSAVNAIQFKMSSGNIDDGIIKLYGVK